MSFRITLKHRSTHWKDRAVGWHTWRIEFDCLVCRQHKVETCAGRIEEIRSLYYHPVCEKCLDDPSATFQCMRCERKVNVYSNPHGADNWYCSQDGWVCDQCERKEVNEPTIYQ